MRGDVRAALPNAVPLALTPPRPHPLPVAGHGQPWRPARSRRAHSAAVGAALAITLGGPLWLALAPPWRAPLAPLAPLPPLAQPPLWLRLLPEPSPAAAPAQAAPEPARPVARPRPRPAPRAAAGAPPATAPVATEAQPITPGLPTAPAPAAPAPAAPAAAASAPPPPLRLGPEVLRRAARDSIAETRRLAAEAGLPAERDASGAERLADAVEQAAKPDCLAPNPGGSLLSIPLIAWEALRQKCK